VVALKDAIAKRPTPKDESLDGRVFITEQGLSWVKDTSDSPVSKELTKLLKRPRCPKCGRIEKAKAEKCSGCGFKPSRKTPWGKPHRRGLGFYALRHTFETIGGDAKDQVAVDHIMGHADNSMAGQYRERIDDDRLQAVVEHVHGWLFGGNQ